MFDFFNIRKVSQLERDLAAKVADIANLRNTSNKWMNDWSAATSKLLELRTKVVELEQRNNRLEFMCEQLSPGILTTATPSMTSYKPSGIYPRNKLSPPRHDLSKRTTAYQQKKEALSEAKKEAAPHSTDYAYTTPTSSPVPTPTPPTPTSSSSRRALDEDDTFRGGLVGSFGGGGASGSWAAVDLLTLSAAARSVVTDECSRSSPSAAAASAAPSADSSSSCSSSDSTSSD